MALILDNSALDARDFSLTVLDSPKAAYAHFRSTGMFGGPLKIPHLVSGQNTFFTINYQLTRSRNANTVSALMPSAAERIGDFSQSLNPQTGLPVAIIDPLSYQTRFIYDGVRSSGSAIRTMSIRGSIIRSMPKTR